METYSFGALWNNPPVGLIDWKQRDLRHPKLFSISCEPHDRITLKVLFPGTNSGARCPQLLHCCSTPNVSHLSDPLLPQIPSGSCFHRGGILTPKIIAWMAMLKGLKAKSPRGKVWLGKEHKIHLFPTPSNMDNSHYPRVLRSPSNKPDKPSLDIGKFCPLMLSKPTHRGKKPHILHIYVLLTELGWVLVGISPGAHSAVGRRAFSQAEASEFLVLHPPSLSQFLTLTVTPGLRRKLDQWMIRV